MIVDDVELYDVVIDPLVTFTYHFVFAGKPLSVNVTLYKTGLNFTFSLTLFPFTVNDPDDGLGL